jgi:hypothetical protein
MHHNIGSTDSDAAIHDTPIETSTTTIGSLDSETTTQATIETDNIYSEFIGNRSVIQGA